MDWIDWLRLVAEVIAVVITWFAGRNHLKRIATRRLRANDTPPLGSLNAPEVLQIMFPRRRRTPSSRQGRLFL